MIRTACIRLVYVALLLVVGTPLAFAGNSSGKSFIGGHVGDGLYFESRMNFLEAIREYNQALYEDVQDRFAWVCLAKAYRARDLYNKVLMRLHELHREQTEAVQRDNRKPIVEYSCGYRDYKSDNAQFGHYRLHRDLFARLSSETPFGGTWWVAAMCYGTHKRIERTISSCVNLRAVYLLPCDKDSEIRALTLENAWKGVDENPSSTKAWLDLALVSNSEIAEAAYHVVLLSDPNDHEYNKAIAGIDHIYQHSRDQCHDFIAPGTP